MTAVAGIVEMKSTEGAKFMREEWLPLLLATLSGALMAIQGSLNAALGKVTGLLEATFIVHLVGTAALAVLLFLFAAGQGSVTAITTAPWYTWLGGLFGVGIIYLVAASIPVLGVANATTAIIVGQVITAIIIDMIGGFQLAQQAFRWTQLLGLVLLAAGAKLLLR